MGLEVDVGSTNDHRQLRLAMELDCRLPTHSRVRPERLNKCHVSPRLGCLSLASHNAEGGSKRSLVDQSLVLRRKLFVYGSNILAVRP